MTSWPFPACSAILMRKQSRLPFQMAWESRHRRYSLKGRSLTQSFWRMNTSAFLSMRCPRSRVPPMDRCILKEHSWGHQPCGLLQCIVNMVCILMGCQTTSRWRASSLPGCPGKSCTPRRPAKISIFYGPISRAGSPSSSLRLNSMTNSVGIDDAQNGRRGLFLDVKRDNSLDDRIFGGIRPEQGGFFLPCGGHGPDCSKLLAACLLLTVCLLAKLQKQKQPPSLKAKWPF